MASNLVSNPSFEEVTQSIQLNIFLSLTILSLNCQGLNSFQRRRFIFNVLSKQHFDIIALQETHAPHQNNWSEEWEDLTEGKSFFPKSKSPNSAGVGFLFHKNFSFKENSRMSDPGGHLVTMCLTRA